MPIEQELITVTEPGQLDRCQGITRFGQCEFVAIEGNQFCKYHISSTMSHREKKNIGVLRINIYRARLEELIEHPEVKSLREELGLLRILLEEELNSCRNATDLMLKSNRIADLIMRIEKIVVSVHKLEKSSGLLLDKSAAIQLAAQFVDIINQEVKDPILIDRIATKLISTIQDLKPTEEE